MTYLIQPENQLAARGASPAELGRWRDEGADPIDLIPSHRNPFRVTHLTYEAASEASDYLQKIAPRVLTREQICQGVIASFEGKTGDECIFKSPMDAANAFAAMSRGNAVGKVAISI